MKVLLFPSEKVVFPNGEIPFGADEQTVDALLGHAQLVRGRRYYGDADIAVKFDDRGGMCSVEFLSGISGAVQPILDGQALFELSADALIKMLLQKDGNGTTDDGGYTYTFPKIGIALYREMTENDLDEMRREMIADGIDPDKNSDFAEEAQKAEHFATICVNAPKERKR